MRLQRRSWNSDDLPYLAQYTDGDISQVDGQRGDFNVCQCLPRTNAATIASIASHSASSDISTESDTLAQNRQPYNCR